MSWSEMALAALLTLAAVWLVRDCFRARREQDFADSVEVWLREYVDG